MTVPARIPVKQMDDLHSRFVGIAGSKGIQFWYVEWPSVIAMKTKISSILFWFDQSGDLIDYISNPDGIEERTGTEGILGMVTQLLGAPHIGNIEVRPFELTLSGERFGLIVSDDGCTASIQPGALLMFQEPWDGEYWT